MCTSLAKRVVSCPMDLMMTVIICLWHAIFMSYVLLLSSGHCLLNCGFLGSRYLSRIITWLVTSGRAWWLGRGGAWLLNSGSIGGLGRVFARSSLAACHA